MIQTGVIQIQGNKTGNRNRCFVYIPQDIVKSFGLSKGYPVNVALVDDKYFVLGKTKEDILMLVENEDSE